MAFGKLCFNRLPVVVVEAGNVRPEKDMEPVASRLSLRTIYLYTKSGNIGTGPPGVSKYYLSRCERLEMAQAVMILDAEEGRSSLVPLVHIEAVLTCL